MCPIIDGLVRKLLDLRENAFCSNSDCNGSCERWVTQVSARYNENLDFVDLWHVDLMRLMSSLWLLLIRSRRVRFIAV